MTKPHFSREPVYISGGSGGGNGKSAYEIAVDNGFVGDESEWLASLVGAKGDTGATGAPGKDGTNGTTGEKGEKGDTGEAGTPGTNGTNGAAGKDGFGTEAQYNDIIARLTALETPEE